MHPSDRVTARDGASIAFERIGDGPPVILVDGALCFRGFGGMPRLAELMAASVTSFCYDRRGRGESPDRLPRTLDSEIADIEALVDAAGGRASLYGISSGGALALEAAAALGDRVDRLAVYEIPYDSGADAVRRWHEYRARLDALVAEGRGGDAVELFMRLVGAGDEGVARMRSGPVWATFEAVGMTLPYDAAALGPDRTVPADRAATVTARTLVMDGGESLRFMPFMRESADELARAVPDAKRRVLEGQSHEVDPGVLAPVLAEFFA